MTLTLERLKQVVSYDAETGIFTWLKPTSNRVHAGRAAKPNGRKRVTVRIDGTTYHANRLAWLYMKGGWPVGVVDHADGDPTNNRWQNLRDVPQQVNTQNIRRPHRDNKTGFQGVVRKPSGKYAANLYIGGRQTNLGLYQTPEQAHDVYVQAKRRHHEGCTL